MPLDRLATDYVSEVMVPPVLAPTPVSSAPGAPVRSRLTLLVSAAVAAIVLVVVLAPLR